MVASGAPAPAGYTFVGSYKLSPKNNGAALIVDVYRKP